MSDIFELITDGDLDLDELKNLLQSNPSIANTMDEQGLTPLIFAIECIEDPEIMTAIIKLLLEHGADPNQEDKETGSTPLIAAIENNNIEIIKLLLEHGANLENQDEKMFTPLNCAVEEGNMEIIKLLLEKGADPNEIIRQQGFTPIAVAASQYATKPKAMDFLLEKLTDEQLREALSNAITNDINPNIKVKLVL
jgi:ankyrin repeat protein